MLIDKALAAAIMGILFIVQTYTGFSMTWATPDSAPGHVPCRGNAQRAKLAKASNLSDLSDATAARANIGLGTMSTQNASAVAITGGSVDGIIVDGGTF